MTNPIVDQKFFVYDADPASQADWTTDAIVLQNGNLLVVAGELSSTGDVSMRQFAVNGAGITANQEVNTTTFGDQKDAKVVQLSNGNIVVSWTDESATAPDFSGETVRVQVFTATGEKIGGEVTVPIVTDGNQNLEAITALRDGRFAVFFEDQSESASSPPTKFRLYNADGTASSGEMALPEGFFVSEGDGFSTTYKSGGLIVAGTSFTGIVSNQVVVQRFNSSGTPSGDQIVLTGSGKFNNSRIEQLENGNYVVTWTDESLTPPFNKGPVVRGQVITQTGETVGSVFTVSEDPLSEHNFSQITTLDDGRFAVTWRSYPDNDSTGYKFVVRIFNADGTPDGDQVSVYDNWIANDGIRNFADLRSVQELPDGRLLYTFRALTPNGQESVAATRIVDPREALDISLGNDGDTFTGTIYADQIRGRGGDDVIDGGRGNDVIFGNEGDDVLVGGQGNDSLFGNDGNDELNGGIGRDRLTGGAGRDILRGGVDSVTDTFIYGSVADSAAGAKTRDIIHNFVTGVDKIDLAAIDANGTLNGDDQFAFSTSGAQANAIWVVGSGADLIVRGDVTGDGVADFEIRLISVASVTAGDFIL